MKIALRVLSLAGFIATLLEMVMKFQANQILLGTLWGIATCAWGYVTWFNWRKEQ